MRLLHELVAHPVIGQVASSPGSLWDVVSSVGGLTVGILGIVTAIVIARRAARQQSAEARAQLVERQRADQEREAKVARREAWRADYEAIRQLLDLGWSIAYRVRNDGPFTVTALADLELRTFRMRAEQLAGIGVEPLRDPLLQLARLADRLADAVVPEDTAVLAAATRPATTGQQTLRLAVAQDRAAGDLIREISSARQVLRTEWGS